MKKAFIKSLPKQHGVWFIFTTAYVMGHFIFALDISKSFLLCSSMFFLIFSQSAMVFFVKERRARRKGIEYLFLSFIYLVIASIPAFYLILRYDLWGLLLFAGGVGILAFISLYFSYTGRDLTVTAEILNILILSTVVPAIGYVRYGKFSLSLLAIWIATAFFYLGSIFRVRYLIRDRKFLASEFPTRLKMNYNSLLYHTLTYLVIIFFSFIGLLPQLMIVAFLPTYLRALYIVVKRYKTPPPVPRIGWAEVLNSVIFIVLSIFAYRVVL